MRVLILGGTGMLGHKLVQVLRDSFDVYCTVRQPWHSVEAYSIFDADHTICGIDVTRPAALESAIAKTEPDVVVNCVGLIKQVAHINHEDDFLRLNGELPQTIAALGDEYGFRSIFISTDCVFSGSRGTYTELDEPDPIDEYGKSKFAGEAITSHSLVLRTSMIGRELSSSHSIVEWFLSHRGGSVKGFTHAIYSGLSTIELAREIGTVIDGFPDLSGLRNVSSEPISKFDLLCLLNDAFDCGIEIVPSDEVIIDRSLDSSLFRSETGLLPPSWSEMVKEMAGDPTPYDGWKSARKITAA